ncbi:C40 family peptidase [Flexivirga caeni]|uniref:NlpC/P60 domain-containing protein n=1 Tax=Flexivirga caeni TaxID=2294115 RepID=A0A3M9M2T7_9MICO|nr:NlpC/P60 family protein [Flexivirga caeni]RNI19455.1 hypothetical protein EFY87_16585 [Flexivirga caeni]
MTDSRISRRRIARAIPAAGAVGALLAGLLLGDAAPADARTSTIAQLEAAIEAKASTVPGLGAPVSGFRAAIESGMLGAYRAYANGTVASSADGTWVIRFGIQRTWKPSSGWPTSDAKRIARCDVDAQTFQRAGTVLADKRWCPVAGYAGPYLAQASDGVGNVQHRGYNGTAVYMMQRRLGMTVDTTNSSVWGPITQSVLDSWLHAHRHADTTTLGPQLWRELHIPYPFNSSTWVAPLRADSAATRAQHVQASIAWAESQVGAEYLWGGTGNSGSSLGYDCSGLQLQVARAGGLDLTKVGNSIDQRPASDLANHMLHDPEMQTVPALRDLQPGDLIFYGVGQHGGHVAMYIGGGWTVQSVYAAVQYQPLYSDGRLNTFGWPSVVGIKRPFASTVVGGSVSATVTASELGDAGKLPARPLATTPLQSGTTLWGLNSWAVSLPELTGTLDRAGWAPVTAGSQLTVSGAGLTVIFAGSGMALGVAPSGHGSLTVPAGATSVLLVPDRQAQRVIAGSPVVDYGQNP